MFSLSRIEPEDHGTPQSPQRHNSSRRRARVIAFVRVANVKTARCSPDSRRNYRGDTRRAETSCDFSLLTVTELLVNGIVEVLRRVGIRTRAAANEHASAVVLHVQHLS